MVFIALLLSFRGVSMRIRRFEGRGLFCRGQVRTQVPKNKKAGQDPTFHNALRHTCQYIRGQPRKRISPAR
ncbi:MAG: hypothetical protein AAAC47_02765, partial [Pararhizobium sp.]